MFEGNEELLNDASPKVALSEEYADRIIKMVQLYQKEKELLYGAVFMLGSESNLGKTRKVCAPLLLFPAYIKFEKGHYFLYIEKDNWRLNPSILTLLGEGVEGSLVESEIMKELPNYPFGYGEVGNMGRLLKKYFPELDTDSLLMYPELWKETRIKRQLQPKQRAEISTFKLVPASGLGVVAKSAETYGILSELEELAGAQDYSRSLRATFGETPFNQGKNTTPPYLPAILNNGQKSALLNARSETLSLVVGPPGTGKSYTIACMALDHLMRGESVLITSKQDEAVDVVARKIEELLHTDEVMIRGGAKSNLRKLKATLRNFLTRPITVESFGITQSDLKLINSQIQELELKLKERLDLELEWSERLLGDRLSDKYKSLIIKTIHRWYKPHWQLLKDLEELLDKRIEFGRKAIYNDYHKRIKDILRYDRQTLEGLNQGLKKTRSSDREDIFENLNHKIIVRAFPIWLCKLADLYRVLPQQKELFDLVIIDEASQCDMATSMAALQRAKRVVVCGDPNQLRHSSFLSKNKMLQLLLRSGLKESYLSIYNFRETSFLDMVSRQLQSQEQVSFLDEHYRSVPEIIRFSNKEFYSNSLRVMNERPLKTEGLGHFEIKVNGRRNEKGVNEKEAEEIIKRIDEIILNEAELENSIKSSIGVLSPLRDQADFISAQLSNQLSVEQMQNHRLTVGTAYAFQGEERDVMFLSFAVDMESHHSAFVHINKPDIFNVSITRAKGRQYVLHSVEPKQLATDHYLRMYLEDIRTVTSVSDQAQQSHDLFLAEVMAFVAGHELKTWVYFSIAGVPIDILLKTKAGLKGIDLIGYPGQYREALTVERFKILGRAGVSVFPLAYSFWKLRREECKEELVRYLKDN